MNHLAQRVEICEVGRRLYMRDLIGAQEGNISVRLSSRRVLCTPSAVCKGRMQPKDLVEIDMDGAAVSEGKPSSEIKLHLAIYRERPDCHAVVHAHPITATAFACCGESIPDDILPEAACTLGSVALAGFGFPGTDEVADRMRPLMKDHKTILMSHHGAVTMGANLEDAANRMEVLERVAMIISRARVLGGPTRMPDEAYVRLLKSAINGSL